MLQKDPGGHLLGFCISPQLNPGNGFPTGQSGTENYINNSGSLNPFEFQHGSFVLKYMILAFCN